MSTDNRFNLIDEPWIPIVDVGRVSLRQVFSNPEYRALGGNPVQKIALTKLLLAIAQAACTPEDDEDWAALGSDGLAIKCLEYLDQWHDRFYLYGDKPFLQMPVLSNLIEFDSPRSFGPGHYPDVLSENNTILTQSQLEKELDDAEKALFVLTVMNFAFGGKRIHKNVPALTLNYQGKTISAKSSPSLGNYVGYLHSYLTANTFLDTIYLNLLTLKDIAEVGLWTEGLGQSPWERMPSGEDCNIARKLKCSYMGCLLSLSRFVLLKGDGIYYIEGIQYPSHKEGWFEPSISLNVQGESTKALWLDVEKKPWRELTSLLAFLAATEQGGFDCMQIRVTFQRNKQRTESIGIWSGGLKVRGSSGDQSVKQDDDFIESHISLPSPKLITGEGSNWFVPFSSEVTALEDLATQLGKCVYDCNSRQVAGSKERDKRADSVKKQSQLLFWQLCESRFQDLVNSAHQSEEMALLRRIFATFLQKSYDTFCPMDTARQIDAWAKNRPNLSKYLKDAMKDAA